MMEINLNGEKEVLDREKTVFELLEQLKLNPEVVTVNVNGNVIGREDFAKILIKNGDEVDVLMFMGGGF